MSKHHRIPSRLAPVTGRVEASTASPSSTQLPGKGFSTPSGDSSDAISVIPIIPEDAINSLVTGLRQTFRASSAAALSYNGRHPCIYVKGLESQPFPPSARGLAAAAARSFQPILHSHPDSPSPHFYEPVDIELPLEIVMSEPPAHPRGGTAERARTASPPLNPMPDIGTDPSPSGRTDLAAAHTSARTASPPTDPSVAAPPTRSRSPTAPRVCSAVSVATPLTDAGGGPALAVAAMSRPSVILALPLASSLTVLIYDPRIPLESASLLSVANRLSNTLRDMVRDSVQSVTNFAMADRLVKFLDIARELICDIARPPFAAMTALAAHAKNLVACDRCTVYLADEEAKELFSFVSDVTSLNTISKSRDPTQLLRHHRMLMGAATALPPLSSAAPAVTAAAGGAACAPHAAPSAGGSPSAAAAAAAAQSGSPPGGAGGDASGTPAAAAAAPPATTASPKKDGSGGGVGHVIRLKYGQGLAGQVAASRQPIIISDAYSDPRFNRSVDLQTGYRTMSMLTVPIQSSSGYLEGVIQLINKQSSVEGGGVVAFSAADESLVRMFCDFGAMVLHNSRAWCDMKMKEMKASWMLDVAMSFNDYVLSERFVDLVDRIVLRSRDVLRSARCTLYLVDEASGSLVSLLSDSVSQGKPTVIRVPLNRCSVAGRCASDDTILCIPDAYDVDYFDRSFDKKSGFRTQSILAVPIRDLSAKRSRVIGVLQWINKRVTDPLRREDVNVPFDSDDVEVGESFSFFVGVCLTNSRVYAHVQRRHQRTISVFALTVQLSELRTVEDVLVTTLQTIRTHICCAFATVILVSHDPALCDDSREMAFFELISDPASGGCVRLLPLGRDVDGLIATVARRAQAVRGKPSALGKRTLDGLCDCDFQSVLCAPVCSGEGIVVGVVLLANRLTPRIKSFALEHVERVAVEDRSVPMRVDAGSDSPHVAPSPAFGTSATNKGTGHPGPPCAPALRSMAHHRRRASIGTTAPTATAAPAPTATTPLGPPPRGSGGERAGGAFGSRRGVPSSGAYGTGAGAASAPAVHDVVAFNEEDEEVVASLASVAGERLSALASRHSADFLDASARAVAGDVLRVLRSTNGGSSAGDTTPRADGSSYGADVPIPSPLASILCVSLDMQNMHSGAAGGRPSPAKDAKDPPGARIASPTTAAGVRAAQRIPMSVAADGGRGTPPPHGGNSAAALSFDMPMGASMTPGGVHITLKGIRHATTPTPSETAEHWIAATAAACARPDSASTLDPNASIATIPTIPTPALISPSGSVARSPIVPPPLGSNGATAAASTTSMVSLAGTRWVTLDDGSDDSALWLWPNDVEAVLAQTDKRPRSAVADDTALSRRSMQLVPSPTAAATDGDSMDVDNILGTCASLLDTRRSPLQTVVVGRGGRLLDGAADDSALPQPVVRPATVSTAQSNRVLPSSTPSCDAAACQGQGRARGVLQSEGARLLRLVPGITRHDIRAIASAAADGVPRPLVGGRGLAIPLVLPDTFLQPSAALVGGMPDPCHEGAARGAAPPVPPRSGVVATWAMLVVMRGAAAAPLEAEDRALLIGAATAGADALSAVASSLDTNTLSVMATGGCSAQDTASVISDSPSRPSSARSPCGRDDGGPQYPRGLSKHVRAPALHSLGSKLTRAPPKTLATVKVNWKHGEFIGSGAFGSVSLAQDQDTGRLMVVKTLPFDPSAKDVQEKIQMLQREVGTMRLLTHPNIVRYIATERAGHEVHILMEYVSGGSVERMVTQYGALSESVAQQYAAGCISGLRYLHSRNIVHGDIKGANILVTMDGIAKLADFGSCDLVSKIVTQRRVPVRGTLLWTAPEVLKQQAWGTYSDVWSVGCFVMEMLTGQVPWQHLKQVAGERTLPELVMDVSVPLPPPPGISELAASFISACCHRNPAQRPRASALANHPWLQAASASLLATEEEMLRAQAGADDFSSSSSSDGY